MHTLLQDLRYGFRMLLKQKGLTSVALLSLALGIGANTALFSIVDAMLLKMLPVKEPERLVLFRSVAPQEFSVGSYNGSSRRDEQTGLVNRTSFAYQTYQRLREQQGPIVSEGDDVVLTFDGRPIKRWHIGPVDGNGPVASAWKLSRVRPGSREPFIVTLDGPIDGRDGDDLAIVDADDHLVDGRRQLLAGETVWTFTPASAWKAGNYRLMVHGTLEDPSGNRLGGHFETSTESPQLPAADIAVAFKAGPDEAL